MSTQIVIVKVFLGTSRDHIEVCFDDEKPRRTYTKPGYESLARIESLFGRSLYPPDVSLSLFTMTWSCMFVREIKTIRTLSIKEDESDV